MPMYKNRVVAVPTSVAAGAGTDVSDMTIVSAYPLLTLTGALTATYQAQGSPDGVQWINDGSALTAAGVVAMSRPYLQVRWNCTAYTSGTPTSVVGGVAQQPTY